MFNEFELDPKKVEEAKKIAAGPLGNEIAKFPLRFAAPVSYGKIPIKNPKSDARNGTAAIVNFGKGPVVISAQHVIQTYKDWLNTDKRLIFQIGNLKIDPIPRIIYESKEYDLVVIKIEEEERKEIPSMEGYEADKEIGREIYTMPSWPPSMPTNQDWVTFGGFPGKWKQNPSGVEFIFDTFSIGPSPVTSVSEDYFICQLEREYCVKSIDRHHHNDLHDLGGLSGSPVFLIKNLHSGITSFLFVGIAYQFSSEFDLMYVRSVKYIKW